MEYLMNYSWAILVVVTVGLVLWQLGVFNTPTSSVTMTGWYLIQPLAPGVVYTSGGNYQVTFNNVAGVAIQIINATVNDTLTETSCSNVLINNKAIQTDGNQSVSSGKEFTLTATCQPKTADQPYTTEIYIEYNTLAAGDMTLHKETGRIQGTVEE